MFCRDIHKIIGDIIDYVLSRVKTLNQDIIVESITSPVPSYSQAFASKPNRRRLWPQTKQQLNLHLKRPFFVNKSYFEVGATDESWNVNPGEIKNHITRTTSRHGPRNSKHLLAGLVPANLGPTGDGYT